MIWTPHCLRLTLFLHTLSCLDGQPGVCPAYLIPPVLPPENGGQESLLGAAHGSSSYDIFITQELCRISSHARGLDLRLLLIPFPQ